jgi:hypothetical protein
VLEDGWLAVNFAKKELSKGFAEDEDVERDGLEGTTFEDTKDAGSGLNANVAVGGAGEMSIACGEESSLALFLSRRSGSGCS